MDYSKYWDILWTIIRGCGNVDVCEIFKLCWYARDSWRFVKNPRLTADFIGTVTKNGVPKLTGHVNYLPEKLAMPSQVKNPSVFAIFTGDIGAPNIDPAYVWRALDVAKEHPQHVFIFQTKSPQNFVKHGYVFPPNAIAATTVTNEFTLWRIDRLKKVDAKWRMVSFEPLLDEVSFTPEFFYHINFAIIGGASKTSNAVPTPDCKPKWIIDLVEFLDSYTSVFVKQLGYHYEQEHGKGVDNWPNDLKPYHYNFKKYLIRTVTGVEA